MTEVLSIRVPFGVRESLEEYGKPRDLVEALSEGLEDGTLTYDGRLMGVCEIDVKDFVSACKRNHRDPQKTLNMITEQLWSS